MAPPIIHLCIRYGKWLASRSTLLQGKSPPMLSGREAGILDASDSVWRLWRIKNLFQNNTNI
jgi:hypothetical protein